MSCLGSSSALQRTTCLSPALGREAHAQRWPTQLVRSRAATAACPLLVTSAHIMRHSHVHKPSCPGSLLNAAV